MTDTTLRASGHWLGTRIGAGGTMTQASSFSDRSLWLHERKKKSLATDVTDAALGASGLWLGTRIGAGGTATLIESLFGRSPWLHGQLGLAI